MSEYEKRIARLQQAMRGQGAALALFAATDQMRYLTGWAEYGHERLVGLFVSAKGEPIFLVPRMNAAQAQHNPAGIKRVIGWDDATGWREEAQDLLAEWGVRDSDACLIDDELYSGHLLIFQELFP